VCHDYNIILLLLYHDRWKVSLVAEKNLEGIGKKQSLSGIFDVRIDSVYSVGIRYMF